MAGAIGGADECYRLRVIRVDEGDVPDLEWREDILYRRPPAGEASEYDEWQAQAVAVDEDAVTVIASFPSAEEARKWLDTATIDLSGMTRSEFERVYFPAEEGTAGAD